MSYRRLPPEMQVKAELELNEVPSRIETDIQHMKEWLKQQPHLKVRKEEQWILNFLRGAKFSLQRAKEKLDIYYTSRTLMRNFYANRDPFAPEIQNVMKMGLVSLTIDQTNPTLPVLLMFRHHDSMSPDTTQLFTICKATLMMIDVAMNECDNLTVNGGHIVVDFKGADIRYLSQVSLAFLKQLSVTIQDAYPIRIKAIHAINFPPILEAIFNVAKRMFSRKFISRLSVHRDSGLKHLQRNIPLAVLPGDYGGTAEIYDEIANQWKVKLESYRDWFLNDSQFGTDEAKRPGKPKTSSDLFGVEGSFRKLDVD